jgi:uncharacterized caspase-like protein
MIDSIGRYFSINGPGRAAVAPARAVMLILCAISALAAPVAGKAAGPGAASPDRRVALVIGNGAYENATRLPNPAKDADLVSHALKSIGFEVVEVTDASQVQFLEALRTFARRADGADIALVYYAGHGAEVDGQNWLIPTDAVLKSDHDLGLEAISQELVFKALAPAKTRIAVFDSARNNPWSRSRGLVLSGASNSETSNPPGFLILYATRAGEVAMDGGGANSPLAIAFARRVTQPGVEILVAFRGVQEDVFKATEGMQMPTIYDDGAGADIYLAGRPTLVAPPLAVVTGSVTPRLDDQPRLALVIGVSDYNLDGKITPNATQPGFLRDLRNGRGDAQDVGKALERLNFKVTMVLDAPLSEMTGRLATWGQQVREAGPDALVVIYFSGHAIQVNGRNYLIPAGAKLPAQDLHDMSPEDAELQLRGIALPLEEFYNRLRPPNPRGGNVVILDSCRDNPWDAAPSSRSTANSRGVVGMADERPAMRRTLVAYATEPGHVADDGEGLHSPFTQALLDRIELPDLPVRELFDEVSDAVDRQTLGHQIPNSDSSSMSHLCIGPCRASLAASN